MRVVVNRQCALGRKTGVGHYTCELLRCLRQQSGADRIDPYPHDWMWQARQLWRHIRPGIANTALTPVATVETDLPPPRTMRERVLRGLQGWGRRIRERHYDAYFTSGAYDLYHEPNHVPHLTDLPTIVTIHDLSVMLHPEWHPRERIDFFDATFHRGMQRTHHILTVSEFTRQEVIRHVGFSPDRVTAVYNGIRPGLRPLPERYVARVKRRLGLPERYLLYLGTIEPRKNVLLLLRAYCSLPSSLRERWPLVLAGGWGWNTTEIADYFERVARSRGVLHLGYVADEDIPAIYNGARALVYPSLYEGFGLPPIEMMACGGAVLASTAGALVEMVGGQAHLIDPLDEDGWRTALQRVVRDDDWWKSLRMGAEELARRYTWERCAAETLQVYRTLGKPLARPLAA